MTDKEVMQMALETAEQIACADYRHWEELASLGEFERWARSRANHIAEALRAALAQPEPEPVAWTVSGLITDFSRDFSAYQTKTYTRPLYTAPPQREWQGLTDEEAEILVDAHWEDLFMLIEFIEAKLKEKNT